MKTKLIFSLALSCVISSCNKPSNFLYVRPPAQPVTVTKGMNELSASSAGSGAMDILWVVGGMTEQAKNFANGVTSFMTNFAPLGDWRMAVVADNVSSPPFLGMPIIFDYKDPNPVVHFAAGVAGAVRAIDREVLFDPTVLNLTRYPQFVRPEAKLIIIMANDSIDVSRTTPTAAQMTQFLAGLKGGDLSRVVVYGVIGATDLNCDPATIDGNWNYHGSEIEKLINATGGQVYSLCDATFAASLAKINYAITTSQNYFEAWIPLEKIPQASTIHVYHAGKELPGGVQENGGVWYYDVQRNAIIFYNLSFSKNATGSVTVKYDEDQGAP